MKKVLLLIMLFVITLSGCSYDNISSEQNVVNIFIENATFENDGYYRFRDYLETNNVVTSYCFSYDPINNMYNCNILTTTYGVVNLYDYASVSFSWGDFKNGVFYAYHELNNFAIIEFKFVDIEFLNNSELGDSFDYNVLNNTFVNLVEEQEIKEYVDKSYLCLKQAISHAKYFLSKNGLLTDLW